MSISAAKACYLEFLGIGKWVQLTVNLRRPGRLMTTPKSRLFCRRYRSTLR